MANNKFNNANTVKDLNGEELKVYISDIYLYADEYIETELCPADKSNAQNCGTMDSITFAGMIMYISDNITKPNNDDIELLDKLFNIYYRLCCKYKQLPTLELFSQMITINNGTLSDWMAGQYRLSSGHGETAKRWRDICKNSLINSLSNSKGSDINKIFIGKAAYGMVETAPVQTINQEQRRTTDQIAADYPLQLPEKDNIVPDF